MYLYLSHQIYTYILHLHPTNDHSTEVSSEIPKRKECGVSDEILTKQRRVLGRGVCSSIKKTSRRTKYTSDRQVKPSKTVL